MARDFMKYAYTLPTQTYSASGSATQSLRDLPKQVLGRLAHVAKFVFNATFTPTTTALPTTVGNNALVQAVDFWDGEVMRFQGGFNHLRQKERMHSGGIRIPDADTDPASTVARYYRRTLHVGPPQFEGAPSDHVIPCGVLENGELRFRYGALTDLAADCTAATGSIRVVAHLVLLDELRIPPRYTYGFQSLGAADVNLAGRALYESLAMLNSASFDAITAGDFANIRLDLGQGDIVPTVKASDLTAAFQDDFARGHLNTVQGDPDAAGDDNGKMIGTTGLATLAVSVDLQPVLWSPPGARISKLFEAASVARLAWSGTQSTAVALVGKFLPQPETVVATQIAKALGRTGLSRQSMRPKTLSKQPYSGPYLEYMPWQVKVK
jgi:hypothetical protein